MTRAPQQLVLSLDRGDLTARLRGQGLATAIKVRVHRNRRTMVTLHRGELRVHEGYAWAPDEVVAAIVRWTKPRLTRDERRAATRTLLEFPVHDFVPPRPPLRRRPEPEEPGDGARLARLQQLHGELNHRWFAGHLGPIPIRLSSRMRRKLGHYESAGDTPAAIVISRRHLRRDGWAGVIDTLLHEMVHQWQEETGLPVDHGAAFRRKARDVGIEPTAVRKPGAPLGGVVSGAIAARMEPPAGR